MCDLRFASEDAKVTTAFARRCVIAEYNVALMPRLIGQANALDLLLSARVLQAPEAAHLGLVYQVVPAGRAADVAMDCARDLVAHCSPWAMAMIKQQVYRFFDTDKRAATVMTRALMAEGTAQERPEEGVAGYLEKRFPRLDPHVTADPVLEAVTPWTTGC